MDKVKQLFAKLWQNKKLLWIIGGVVVLLVAAIILIAVFSVGNSNTTDGGEKLTDCTIEVKTEGGMALKGVGVYVYADSEKEELIYYAKTNEEGVAAIKEAVPNGSVVVLDSIPAGYTTEESYPITKTVTKIILSTYLLDEMTEITAGSVMFDFTVTTPEGTEYTLSKLLEEKKAVVLNLWYTGCELCKVEFPYLQEAYEAYSGDIELLAIDPETDDDDADIALFRTENGLTFPMAKCDDEWKHVVTDIAYPTTIIIDRFGTVALIHTGSIDNAKTFKDAFAFFCAEDYVQTVVESIENLKSEAVEESAGTKDDPFEFSDVSEIEVSVESEQTVYCSVSGISGMAMEVESENLKVTYGDTVFEANEDGIITFIVNTADADTPAFIAFTNTGSQAETYKVTFSVPEGTEEAPKELLLGDFIAELLAGNEKGLYYAYTVGEDGVYTITEKEGDNEAEFALVLKNITSSVEKTLEKDGITDKETGVIQLSVDVKAGDELQLVITAKPDEDNVYPSASIILNAAVVQDEHTDSSDSNGIFGNSGSASTGNETGGPGSSVGNTNTGGLIGGNSSSGGSTGGNTSTGGSAGGNAGASTGESSNTGTSGNSGTGTLVNPDAPVEIGGTLKFDAEVKAGTRVLYNIYKVSGTTLTISDPDVYAIYNGITYRPTNGAIYIALESESPHVPVVIEIGNSGSINKTFSVSMYYPAGSYMNPYGLALGEFTTNLTAGNEQGVYYTFTATANGTLIVELLNVTNGVNVDIVLYNERSYMQKQMSETEGTTAVVLEKVRKGDVIQVIIGTLPDENFNYPAATVVAKASMS